jgi:O-antigen ligase
MRRVVRVLLLAFTFAIPWEYSLDTGEPFGNIARIIGLVLLAAAIPAVLLSGKLRTPGPLQWLVLAFLVWSSCTCFWTIDQAATLARLRGYVQVMMPVWLIWEFAETPEDLRDLLRAWAAGSWVLAVLTVVSVASAGAAQIRFVAEGQDPNDVARFLDLGFPVSALLLDWESRWWWKLLALGYLPVGMVGVLLTASRGGFLAAVVALVGCGLLLLTRHLSIVFAGVLSLPAILAAFRISIPHETIARISTIPQQLQRGDLNQRLNIWSAGWQAFVHRPFSGSGVGTFVHAARLAAVDTAHNTALTVAVECGIVAVILASTILAFCAYSVFATRGSVRLALGTALLVWLVTSLVATVEANRTTWLLMGLLSLAGRLEGEEPGLIHSSFPCQVPDRQRASGETV